MVLCFTFFYSWMHHCSSFWILCFPPPFLLLKQPVSPPSGYLLELQFPVLAAEVNKGHLEDTLSLHIIGSFIILSYYDRTNNYLWLIPSEWKDMAGRAGVHVWMDVRWSGTGSSRKMTGIKSGYICSLCSWWLQCLNSSIYCPLYLLLKTPKSSLQLVRFIKPNRVKVLMFLEHNPGLWAHMIR